jgi:glycosyltransferase involved in cell wall biosynthesis
MLIGPRTKPHNCDRDPSALWESVVRILILASRFTPAIGGVERHVSEVSLRLARRGHDVRVVCGNVTGSATRVLRSVPDTEFQGVKVTRGASLLVSRRWPQLGWLTPVQLSSVSKWKNFDVCYSHGYGYPASYLPYVTRIWRHRPWVITPHMAPESTMPKWAFDSTIGHRVLSRATRVIAITEPERNALERLGAKVERLSVIPNGVDTRRFHPGGAHQGSSTQTGVRLLFVGRLVRSKGVEWLLRAIASLRANGLNIRLTIAGPDGGDCDRLQWIAREVGVEGSIRWLGEVDERSLPSIYSQHDVFVLPSTAGEAQGIVLLEAMASGLPIVATAVGGIPATVIDGANGILVAPSSPDAIASALIELASNQEKRLMMQKNNLTRVADYDWDMVVNSIESVLSAAVAEYGHAQ